MIDLPLGETGTAVLALLVVLGMLVLFVRETFRPEVTAIAGAAAMLLFGLVPYDEARKALSSPAPWTILALFLMMGALVRTGVLDWLTRQAGGLADRNATVTLAGVFLFTAAFSAFLNNTPVVVVMIPVLIQMAKKIDVAPSKLLIPLSYAAILGGTCTMIGTSTNLLVDGVARGQGLAPFHLFEILPLGAIQVVIGLGYLALFGRYLLPDRQSMGVMLSDRRKLKYFTEVAVPEGSALIGRKATEVELFRREGVRLIDVLRGDASLRRDIGAVVLEAGDRVVLRTEMAELLGLQQSRDVRMVDKLSSVRTETVEVLITPGCRMIGRSLGSLRLRRRYGVYPLAVHRRNQNIGRQLDDLVVVVGDTLLLEGAPEDIARLAADMDLVDITRPTVKPFRRRHAPVAALTMVGIVACAGLGFAPILTCAVIGAAIVLLTRCIDSDEALSFVDGQLLALIFSMLVIGAALDHSGAARLLVGWVEPALTHLPHALVILVVYVIASTLTEVVTNNAVAVILTPIAIELGGVLGIDPRPLVVAVMFAASASFATPVGYQTNTLVFGPGGYKFADYLRVGIPMNLIMALNAAIFIPLIWPTALP